MSTIVEVMNSVEQDMFEDWLRQGLVEVTSTSFLRGINFENAYVIFDEIQNADLVEIRTVYTRLKSSSKMVSIGSVKQVDNQKIKKVRGMIPFELYMLHFKHKPSHVRFHTLVKCYRSWFADFADDIDETIRMLESEHS
jgi:predicted ribonuclease YlaK